MSNLNRRDFLKLAGKVTLGAAAVAAIPAAASAEAEIAAPAWPWTYKPLDKEEVKARVYANFSTHGGCCAGVSSGILELLAEKYGYPYNQIDGRMFANGGGGYGRQNLCGALGGAFAILGLFLTSSDSGSLRNQLYAWYETTAFPIYNPENLEALNVHSVSGSELCKDSVNNWMALSGFDFGSAERRARCASLSADVAAKAIELLNIHFGYETAPSIDAEAVEEPALAANEYIGVGKGFGGDIKVKVTMDGNKIAKIEVLEHAETAGIFDKAYPTVTDAIVAANGVEGIDAVAGATFSSNGLIEAVQDALSKVK
ncbi:MAG: FMN-binding protein [Clostridiales bacterium]|nr:FMN-binding protein [Clostridiales bacterium]